MSNMTTGMKPGEVWPDTDQGFVQVPVNGGLLVPMHLEIDPAQINQMVSRAILESSFGITLKDLVARKARDLGSPYGEWTNTMNKAIDDEILKVLHLLVRGEYREQLEAKVRTAIEGRLTQQVVDGILDSIIHKLTK